MKHVHYDLAKIEAATRNMFATAPSDSISDNADVVAAFRRSVDIEIACQKWALSEMMAGTTPDIFLSALEAIIVNLILNRMRGFDSDPDGGHVIYAFTENVFDGIANSVADGTFESKSGHAVSVKPVVSGNA